MEELHSSDGKNQNIPKTQKNTPPSILENRFAKSLEKNDKSDKSPPTFVPPCSTKGWLSLNFVKSKILAADQPPEISPSTLQKDDENEPERTSLGAKDTEEKSIGNKNIRKEETKKMY